MEMRQIMRQDGKTQSIFRIYTEATMICSIIVVPMTAVSPRIYTDS